MLVVRSHYAMFLYSLTPSVMTGWGWVGVDDVYYQQPHYGKVGCAVTQWSANIDRVRRIEEPCKVVSDPDGWISECLKWRGSRADCCHQWAESGTSSHWEDRDTANLLTLSTVVDSVMVDRRGLHETYIDHLLNCGTHTYTMRVDHFRPFESQFPCAYFDSQEGSVHVNSLLTMKWIHIRAP